MRKEPSITHHPRGVTPGQTQTRFASTKPSSYNSENRTVDAVISMGSPVVRVYGTEKLRISPDAVMWIWSPLRASRS
jgi:hypothetical protein